MDLSDVSIESLMKEVQRRLECQTKPEKRVILVGALLVLQHVDRSLPPQSSRVIVNAFAEPQDTTGW